MSGMTNAYSSGRQRGTMAWGVQLWTSIEAHRKKLGLFIAWPHSIDRSCLARTHTADSTIYIFRDIATLEHSQQIRLKAILRASRNIINFFWNTDMLQASRTPKLRWTGGAAWASSCPHLKICLPGVISVPSKQTAVTGHLCIYMRAWAGHLLAAAAARMRSGQLGTGLGIFGTELGDSFCS